MAGFDFHQALLAGLAIPAHPLALTAERRLNERYQRGLTRYYLDAGVGGLAVGVHTTQFAIRQPRFGLFRPVLELAKEEMDRAARPLVRIGGICGATSQAVAEAELLRELGYHAGLLSLAGFSANTDEHCWLQHARRVGQVLPLVGFYLQPAVGGRALPYSFWRSFVEIESVVAIKVAPFNRYQTLDVVRAVADSGRQDIALYTGNDDNIVADLVTSFRWERNLLRFVGGLLGHWSVWTKTAVEVHRRCRTSVVSPELLELGVAITDCNAAFFDAAHHFRGCIAGIHEVLRRQGLMEGLWCLDEQEGLSPGQLAEIDRVYRAYPFLHDDEFVQEHRDRWLAG
jgi:dihydrodipicolinate synthase/N-acetylneuraminate lyase